MDTETNMTEAVEIKCSDNKSIMVMRKDFYILDVPRYWKLALGMEGSFKVTSRNVLDLTFLNARVDIVNVLKLLVFLKTGHIDVHHIFQAQYIATLFGGCPSLDEFAQRIKYNPTTPDMDYRQEYEWKVLYGHDKPEEGWMVTLETREKNLFWYRKKK